MRHIHRRQVLAGGAVYAVAFVETARAQQQATLQASYSSGAFRDLMTQAAGEFERQPRGGARIQYRAPVLASLEDHLQQTLRWAVTDDLPDVSFQANNHIAILAQRELTVPLDRFIARETAWAELGYTASVADVGRVEGQVHGLPFQISVPVTYFNLDLVRRAGGDPANLPRTWDGAIDLAHRVHAAGGNAIGGFFDYNATGNWTFQALIASQDGRMMTQGDRAIAFDGAEGLLALDLIRRFGQTGMVDMNQEQMYQAFAAGQIGVMATTNNMLGTFERQAAGRFQIGVVPWPLLSPAGRLPAGGHTTTFSTSTRPFGAGSDVATGCAGKAWNRSSSRR